MMEENGPRPDRLADDLEALAAQERRRFEVPPTDDELRALHEGKLDAAEAERLRDFLAVHPEWAEAYLEMIAGDAVAEDAVAEDAVVEEPAEPVDEMSRHRVWRALEARLEGEEGVDSPDGRRGGPARERERRRRRLALAAALVVAVPIVALAWLFMRSAPTGDVYALDLPSSARGASLDVPLCEQRIELIAPLDGLGDRLEGRHEIVLSTGDRLVASRIENVRRGQDTVSLIVPSSRLQEAATYRLSARPAGGGEPVLLSVFRLRFVE